MQIIFHKRATKYRALLRKMTYKDKGSYESSPPCTDSTMGVDVLNLARDHMFIYKYTCTYLYLYIYIYTYIYIYIYMFIYIYIYIYIFTSISISIYLYIYEHLYNRGYPYSYTHFLPSFLVKIIRFPLLVVPLMSAPVINLASLVSYNDKRCHFILL